MRTLDSWFGEVAEGALVATSTAVTDAAAYYERTDQAAAAQLDATYPPAELTDAREHTDYVPIEPPEDTARYGDVVEPQRHLRELKDYNQELDGSPNWWDAFSPMAHIGNAIESVTWLAAQLGWMDRPIDPQAEIVKPWVGDWAGVRAAADVFERLGHLSRGAAININWASQSTEDVWTGRAGEGSALYLMNLGRPLNNAQQPLVELSKQYKIASEEMVTLRDAVVNVLNEIGDAAIEAAVAAGVSGGTDCYRRRRAGCSRCRAVRRLEDQAGDRRHPADHGPPRQARHRAERGPGRPDRFRRPVRPGGHAPAAAPPGNPALTRTSMTQFPTNLNKLVELAEGTPYEHLATDEQALERMFLDALKASNDPMLREIGSGIADRSMTWHTIATHSAYAEFVEESLQKAKEFDGGVLAEELGREQERAAEAERREQERAEESDSKDLFGGGVLKKRRK